MVGALAFAALVIAAVGVGACISVVRAARALVARVRRPSRHAAPGRDRVISLDDLSRTDDGIDLRPSRTRVH
jgi:hypothetical protein